MHVKQAFPCGVRSTNQIAPTVSDSKTIRKPLETHAQYSEKQTKIRLRKCERQLRCWFGCLAEQYGFNKRME